MIHLPTATSGNAWGLSRGERALGLQSDVLVLGESSLGYPADRNIILRQAPTLWNLGFNYCTLGLEVVRLLARYEIFHFNYGSSLIDFPQQNRDLLDLPLYRLKGKVFVTFNGCDARQRDVTIRQTSISACQNEECYGGICVDGRHDERVRRRIDHVDALADGIFALTPDLLRYLPARAIYLPVTVADWNILHSSYPEQSPSTIRIAHAPTNRGAKGTDLILRILDEVRRRYPNRVEVVLIEQMSHAQAIRLLSTAHLMIDQILIGWYGAAAVEAMRMGIPVIAYIREEDLARIPQAMADDCKRAVISADPATLLDRLCTIVEDPGLLLQQHARALDYVGRWHDPVRVGAITKECYEIASS